MNEAGDRREAGRRWDAAESQPISMTERALVARIYALFDCFIVEADSNQTEPEITPTPENTPGSGGNIPVTGDKTSFAAAFCIIAAAAAAIFAVIKRKSEA